MGQVLHGSAKTTHAIRAAIQRSQASMPGTARRSRPNCGWNHARNGHHECSYNAQVRIRVRAGDNVIRREGSGSGHGVGPTPGEAHEHALKQAETDAMKRALVTFGNPFGLALYDKEQNGVRHPVARKSKSIDGRQAPGWFLVQQASP